MKDYFTQVYNKQLWGPNGSGPGSTPTNTTKYREFLQRFFKEKNIKTIIDYGCGDWQFSRLLNFDGIDYLGIDCVDKVVEDNVKLYQKNNIKFLVLNKMEEIFPYKADLLILKDVLQHWTTREIDTFFEGIRGNYKYILITNSSKMASFFRNNPLSAKTEPLLKYHPKIVLEYSVDTPKETSLLENF